MLRGKLLLFISDLTFLISDFDDEVKQLLMDAIESRGGLIVGQSFRGVADYAVVPLLGAKLSQTVIETVTYLWVVSTVYVLS
jgi:hypothetical protein